MAAGLANVFVGHGGVVSWLASDGAELGVCQGQCARAKREERPHSELVGGRTGGEQRSSCSYPASGELPEQPPDPAKVFQPFQWFSLQCGFPTCTHLFRGVRTRAKALPYMTCGDVSCVVVIGDHLGTGRPEDAPPREDIFAQGCEATP